METWTFNQDKSIGTVTGRVPQPWYKKINPVWWFMNSEEPTPPVGYLPGKWYRVPAWYLRNPLQNFGKYVIGVYDQNYTVVGTAPVDVTAWNDLPGGKTGWKYSIIKIWRLKLPFVSYVGKSFMFYAGWQWWGFFGFKINKLHSDIQIV